MPPGTSLRAESTNSQHFLRAHSGPKRCVSTCAAHTITAARRPCAVPQILSCILLFAAHRAPPSMGGPRQEYWSGLPFPPPEDIPNPGIEPLSRSSPTLQVDSLPLNHGEAQYVNALVNDRDRSSLWKRRSCLQFYSGEPMYLLKLHVKSYCIQL